MNVRSRSFLGDFADVSSHQTNIDWKQYAASGRKLAVCKTTEGYNWIDSSVQGNREALQQQGLECGLYHFAGSTIDGKLGAPATEADFYLGQVGHMGKNEFPVLDYERSWGKTPTQQAQWIKQWGDEVEQKTGKTPWVYLPTYILDKMSAADCKTISHFPIWYADPDDSPDGANPPAVPAPLHLAAWQYTSTAKIPGIGACDDSFLYRQPPHEAPPEVVVVIVDLE